MSDLLELNCFHSTRYPLPPLQADRAELVEITTSGEGPAFQQPKVFTAPRNVLSASSEYFRAMLDFKARQNQGLRTEHPDAQPWVISTFISWLKDGKIRFTEDAPAEWVQDSADAQKKRFMAYTWNLNGVGSTDVDTQTIPAQYRDYIRPEDPNQPISWQYAKLFELYIFGEKYDSRLFRQTILEICQLKYQIVGPRLFRPPEEHDVEYLTMNLPASSPLREMVADCFTSRMTDDINLCNNRSGTSAYHMGMLTKMPQDFVAQVTVSQAKRAQALSCHVCAVDRRQFPCSHHTKDDGRSALNRDWCFYHQHEGDAEKEVCKQRKYWLKGLIQLRKDRVDEAQDQIARIADYRSGRALRMPLL